MGTKWIEQVRAQFPQLKVKMRGHDLCYLDSAATTLRPQIMIDRMTQFYSQEVANVHRGAHYLSDRATAELESARQSVADFIGAASASEIIFTRGTTESINLVAQSWAKSQLTEGDIIVLTEMEHHSNIVPWQMIAEEKRLKIMYVKVLSSGELDLAHYEELLRLKPKLVSVVSISNVLGLLNPIAEMTKLAQAVGARVVVDAAQSVACRPTNVQELGVDFLAFSGHKIFAPFGVGVLYAKGALAQQMPPYQGGGSMIERVTLEKTDYNQPPHRFEAGTPAVAEIIALRTSLEFLRSLGFAAVEKHESEVMRFALDEMKKISSFRLLGEMPTRSNIVSFSFEGAHPSDVGQILDQEGVAIRTGHLCAQPLLQRFGKTSIARASFSIYTDENDIKKLIGALKKAEDMLL